MNPSLVFSLALVAGGIAAAQNTGTLIEPVEPADSPFILPFDEAEETGDEGSAEEEIPAADEPAGEDEEEPAGESDEEPTGDGEKEPVDPGLDPDLWFPGNPGGPDVWILYTMGGGEEPVSGEEDPELHPWDPLPPDVDPVIYQSGIPAAPRRSFREKRAAFHADIAAGCEVTFSALDADESGGLNVEEFSVRRPGPAGSHRLAFRRADRDRDESLSLAEFTAKKPSPSVMPVPLGLLEASGLRASFNSLDFDGNGFLTYGEFTAVLRPSGPGVLEAIFAEADRNGDGKISFPEYTHRPVNPAGVE